MAKDTKNKKEKNNKRFFKEFRAEIKKVIWPTPKQLLNNTVAVLTIVLITAIIVFALDFVFEKMNTYGINKLKEIVTSSNEIGNNTIDANVTSNDVVTTDGDVTPIVDQTSDGEPSTDGESEENE